MWFEDARWSWGNCISFRFVDYNDNIDRCAFFFFFFFLKN